MSKIDGRVSFTDLDDPTDPGEKFIQFSVLALMDIEEQYDCSIEALPEILQGQKVRNAAGQLVPAPIRYELDAAGEQVLEKGKPIQLDPEPPRLKEVVTLFRAGMLEYDDRLTAADVGKMMTRITVTKAGELLHEAVIAAFPEANKGNRQQRRGAASGKRKAAPKK